MADKSQPAPVAPVPSHIRNVKLTFSHGVLILAMLWGFFTALIAATERVLVNWREQGLIYLLLLVAVEAILTQRLVARERRRIEEQAGIRGLELLVIVLLVRVWSLRAEGAPLVDVVEPWLRSPLMFFGGTFGQYFLCALGAWALATLLAADVIEWTTDWMIGGAAESTIERDQLRQEWGQNVARFDRRYLLIVVITFAASGFALYDVPLFDGGELPRRGLLAALAGMVTLVAGLLLHSIGRLNQLQRNWDADSIDVDASVDRRWSRPAALLVLGLVLVAPLVSWLVLLTPPPPLIPFVNLLLGVMTVVVSLVFLVLLSPLILLLSLFRGERPQVPPQLFQPPQLPVAQETVERPLLPALIFWGCMLLLLVIALGRYVQGRADLQDTLRRWRLTRWLLHLFGLASGLWVDARGWVQLAGQRLRYATRRRPMRRRRAAPRSPQAQLRTLFRRMQNAGARRGVPLGTAQTPLEYAGSLGQSLPMAREDVQGLTEAYVVGEYGPRPPGTREVRRARHHWRRLQRWLLGSKRLRRGRKDQDAGDEQ